MKKPSVTELISLLDKPALLVWANQQGLLGVDISVKRNTWLNNGSSLHKQIENFCRHGSQFENPVIQSECIKFLSDKKIIGMEVNIETDWFQGRYDCKLIFNNKIYLCDFKTKKPTSKIYLENKLQLVAYSMAENCDGLAVINIPSFTFNEVKIKDRVPYEEILKSLSSIYTNKKLI